MKFQLLIKGKMVKNKQKILLSNFQMLYYPANKCLNGNNCFNVMSRINFLLSWVEHEKGFITSGPGGLSKTYWYNKYVHLLFKGSLVEFSKLWCFVVSEGCFNLSKQCRLTWNAALCCISSESSLFAKVPVKGFLVYNSDLNSFFYLALAHDSY